VEKIEGAREGESRGMHGKDTIQSKRKGRSNKEGERATESEQTMAAATTARVSGSAAT